MPLSRAESALIVARFFDDYANTWIANFPRCLKKGHWHILVSVRMSDDGILMKNIRGRMTDICGMDDDTSEARLRELKNDGFVKLDDDSAKVKSSTCLLPTEKLCE